MIQDTDHNCGQHTSYTHHIANPLICFRPIVCECWCHSAASEASTIPEMWPNLSPVSTEVTPPKEGQKGKKNHVLQTPGIEPGTVCAANRAHVATDC